MSTLGRGARALRGTPWWVAPLTVALLARLAFRFAADEPILYSHPYNYFHGALAIVESDHPWRFVLASDDWHRWLGPWTIAPLYYLCVAALFALFGPHLLPVQLAQFAADAGVAVMVAWMGRRIAGPLGVWAGIAYAVNFHAVELSATTLTENAHTPLVVAAVVVLMAEGERAAARPGWRSLSAGGFLLGLSALARAVSTAFVPVASLWRWRIGGRRGFWPAVVLATGAAAAVVPWTARNAVFIHDLVPVETNGIYNLYDDNAFVVGAARAGQEARILGEPTLAGQRALATRFALRGIARHPGLFVEKAWRNLLHLIRPDGLQNLLVVEEPMPAWRHAALLLLDDALVLPVVVLFSVWLLAGRASPARGLIALWTGYYLLMVVGLFHNEIRYRSTLLPFALAGAAGGLAVLRDATARRRAPARLALVASGALVALVVAPYVVPAVRALRSAVTLRGIEGQVRAGDLAGAEARVARAAARDPGAARPWLVLGGALARADRPDLAVEALRRARSGRDHVWLPIVVLPTVLREAGRPDEAAAAVAEANAFSWNVDPWLALEAAWRALPAPRLDEVTLGAGDYGAVRGFSNPQRGYRWTLHEACVRLRPTTPAAAYDVTLWMGSPEPSPLAAPVVEVRPAGGPPARLTLTRAVLPYTVRVSALAGVAALCLDAPTWNHGREPAEQGVRVDRVRAAPAP